MEVHESLRNKFQDNLIHWLISTQALARGYDAAVPITPRDEVQARTPTPGSRRIGGIERRLGSAEGRLDVLRQVERAAAGRGPTKVLRRRMFAKRRLQLDRHVAGGAGQAARGDDEVDVV